jgi:lysophospholipid acyltransferase (LPLAT)-like uncharacterized protein
MLMPIPRKLTSKLKGIAVAWSVRGIMRTLDCQVAFYDPTVDPVHPDFGGPAIYVFWHEYIPAPFYYRGHCNIAMLISQHRDADWLSAAAAYMGFETVRGSSRRGAAAALLGLVRKGETMNLAITPDGPRGPRRVLAPGPIYLSSKLQLPLVALGVGYDRPWRMPTWDRFALPRPYSRVRALMSPKIHIPPDLDRGGVEHYRQNVERLLTRLTVECECWAESGTRKIQQQVVRRQSARKSRRGSVDRTNVAGPSVPLPSMPKHRQAS